VKIEKIGVSVNGVWQTLEMDPEKRLVDILREDLHLTGTKRGCDGGQCGACSVLIQGKLRRSCTVPIKKIAGQEIVTIEGLGTPDQLHPIQEAFIETGAIQCGFCTPGMIIATKALLDSNPRPSLDEIKKGLVRNLCRCTGYVKIFDAVRLASQRFAGSRSTSTDQGKRNAVGVSIPLLDGIEKATGRGQYGDDLFLPGMLHGKVVRSPHAHAEILGIDAREASAMPGVRAVLSAADIDGPNLYGRFVKDQPVLCGDRARLVGDPVALVVAETEKQAEDAALRVAVNYNPLPGVFDAMEALRETASKLHPTGNICAEKKIFSGDGEKGFRESEHILQKTYVTPFAEHAYMEPEAGVGYIDEDGRLVVAAGTQSAHFTQKEVAYALGLEKDQVRVIQTKTGGGFGGKHEVSVHCFLGLAALKLRRPVKIRYSRQESMATTYKRHPFRMDLKVGTKRDGSLCAIHTNYFANTGAYIGSGTGVFTRAMLHSTGPYHFPHVNLSVTGVFTNNPNSSGMRGFGVPQVALAIESHLDQLAQELGIDPWEMRYKNAYTSEHILPTGHPIPGNVEMRPCLEAIRPYYESMKSDVAKRNRDSRGARYGVGLGAAMYGIGITGLLFPGRVRVLLEEDGTLVGRGQLLAWLKLQPMSSEFPLTW
jgi:CO/xanthine dehydrogenase Mo-binding subunit/aerobic-type carbon monoxide dehydrogenase small subunit (CoxS/CutS family)